MTKRIVIAGTSSGVGKTTITMGLIAALRQQGLHVQPFKAGPDYIDPTYHTLAAGHPCRNIDTWMVPPERSLTMFEHASKDADIAVIEGVMGLFDGSSYLEETGSTAEIAKLIDAPVLLILDVGKMARSVGALSFGYANFDSGLKILGFILNRCGSKNHYEGVKSVVEMTTGKPVLGWLPKEANLYIPERHLGLVPTDERGELTAFINSVATLITQHFDLKKILSLLPEWSISPTKADHKISPISHSSSPKIAVARDAAFSFYYEDNLDYLRRAGAEIVFFSPLEDCQLPAGTKGLYLGGGFPEIYAAQLANNQPMRQAIQAAYANNIPIYAECGGFMYLTETIIDQDKRAHAMVGLIPGITEMQDKLASLGYRLVESSGNFLLPAGQVTRGHEFHWTKWRTDETLSFSPAWHVQPRRANSTVMPSGYTKRNLVASYIHLHFAYEPRLAENFVRATIQA
ncbi:MAG: cobyrinate a,c-diamide synthase [Chloroflexota bacterium]